MESIEDILAKRSQVIEIFQRMGITPALAQEYGNVKLMKLIYFFYIKYMGLLLNVGQNGWENQENQNKIAADSMARFRFSAWPYGPVETTVYSLIGMIREQLGIPHEDHQDWLINFPTSNPEYLNESLDYVSELCRKMTAAELVTATHEKLHKWSNTPMYQEMSFTNEDYMDEYNHLPVV